MLNENDVGSIDTPPLVKESLFMMRGCFAKLSELAGSEKIGTRTKCSRGRERGRQVLLWIR